MKTISPKKKKDFKIEESIALEFERLAPSGKQTLIIENLIAGWIADQRRREVKLEVQRAYTKGSKR